MTAKQVGLSRRSALKGLAVAAGAIPLLGGPLSAVAAPPASGGEDAGGCADEAAKLTGRLVFPQDPDYDAARAGTRCSARTRRWWCSARTPMTW